MRAVVFKGIGEVEEREVEEPRIEEATDAVVRLTASAICGTDLHFLRGTMAPVEEGLVLGHEGVGIVEEVGDDVRNLEPGDRVVICSTIACGNCSYCRAGYFSQCDEANPNGSDAGTAFFGGPEATGSFDGLQAERARVPHAAVGCVKLPDSVNDEQAILLSDIFPTGYFGADMAAVKPGRSVCVWGCGPVGIFAVIAARLMGAGRIFAVDRHADRLELARRQGAEAIDFSAEDPVETLRRLTGGIGPDCAIDAVGVEAERSADNVAGEADDERERSERELEQIVAERAEGERFQPGDAPTQAVRWAVESLAKAGTLAIIGVYPPTVESFPIGAAMNKNLTIRMGNCNHRRYVPHLVGLVASGEVDPVEVLSEIEPLDNAVEAYERFDEREAGWLKVELEPAAPAR